MTTRELERAFDAEGRMPHQQLYRTVFDVLCDAAVRSDDALVALVRADLQRLRDNRDERGKRLLALLFERWLARLPADERCCVTRAIAEVRSAEEHAKLDRR